jgi:hypothetical protein
LKEGAGGEEIEYMLKLNKLLSAMPTSWPHTGGSGPYWSICSHHSCA